ncbi:MAG: hypothetical protein GY856_04495 [bacterium]|nr:hypothetical protein [bacterium]
MTACDRFEREAVLRMEQGLALDEHFTTCPDCRRTADTYQRLQAGLASTGAEYQPRPDWQARTWAAIARGRERRRRWLRTLVPAAIGACVLALLLIPQLPRAPIAPALEVEVLPPASGPARRGTEAGLGDRLLLGARTGGASHAELRVYLNDSELVLRCSSEPPCIREDETLRAALELSSLGTYQSLLLVSDNPLPAPAEDLDGDAGRALAAGARVELGEAVLVR